MTNEDRLVEIETKISFQEDLIQELNNAIYEQQKKIDRLEAICNSLVGHIKDLSRTVADGGVGGNAIDERPPHY